MPDYQINTDRLMLIPLTIPILESIIAGPEAFLRCTSFVLPAPYTEFPESMEYTINSILQNPPEMPWSSYAIILKSAQTYIGQCGFKSSPDANGFVELGYEIAREFRLQGYAGEAILVLIDTAFSYPQINSIIAHTLAEQNISNHLLVNHGFVFEKSIIDEEDGKIWKWVLNRKVYHWRKLIG